MLPAPIPPNEPERIASLRRMLLLSTPDEEAFDRVTRAAQRLFGVPIALVSLIDSHRQWFKSCIGLPVRETGRDVSFCGHAILGDELFIVEDALKDPRFLDNPLATDEPHVIFYAGRPLHNSEGHAVGTLCIIDHQPRTLSADDQRALRDLGYWVESIFASRELSQVQASMLNELDEMRRTSLLDPMLNIWNRGASVQMLERESLRAFRNHTSLSVMMIDLDQFKRINTDLGRAAGDEVLIEVTKRLLGTIRSYDSLGRYGGDEFIIVLPDATREVILEIAGRLLRAISYPFVFNDNVFELSICIGIATADFVHQTPDPGEQIAQAEQALLAARQQGTNQIHIWSSAN